jgi:hypothetical protein
VEKEGRTAAVGVVAKPIRVADQSNNIGKKRRGGGRVQLQNLRAMVVFRIIVLPHARILSINDMNIA